MKNISKSSSKFSSCFRPAVVDMDAMLDPPPSLPRSSSFRFACLPVSPKHQPTVSHTIEQPHESVVHHPPKSSFSLVIKALAIQTILNIRARPRSRRGSKRRSSSDERTILNQATADSNIPETKEEPTSSSSSSHGSPSSCWSPGSESENLSKSSYSNKADYIEKQKKSVCLGIFMVLVSLTFTVIWGKYWGAFLTSTWLYFFSLGKAGKLWPRKTEGQIVDNRRPSLEE